MMVSPSKTDRHYLIDAVLRSCEVLKAFRESNERLTLSQIVGRTHINKTTSFRLLRSLEHGGLLHRVGDGRYQLEIAPAPRRRFRLGLLIHAGDDLFGEEIRRGLRVAAESEQAQLIEFHAHDRPKEALRQLDAMVQASLDLAVAFQTNAGIAMTIAARFREAHIPLIAIDVPHPGATFYGVDNYRAGVLAGRELSRWAATNWNGQVDEVVLLEQVEAGPLVHSRLQGVVDAVQDRLRRVSDPHVRYLDCRGRFDKAWEVVRRLLRDRGKRRLFGSVNAPSALGALRAIEEAGAESECVVVGQGADRYSRRELRRRSTRLIGAVAYFPERYGSAVIALAVNLLHGKDIPPAVFVRHRLVTPANVDRLYPNDSLLGDDR